MKRKQKEKVVSLAEAKRIMKENNENFTIRIKKGTIYQGMGHRYFIDKLGVITYMTGGIIKKIEI